MALQQKLLFVFLFFEAVYCNAVVSFNKFVVGGVDGFARCYRYDDKYCKK